ncbi:MAG: hypothetical protein ABIH70_06250 [Chloroflexota bacterium]
MSDKRMLIVDAELIRRIDESRGDMNCTDFLHHLLDSCFEEDSVKQGYITKDEFRQFQQETRGLLRSFLEFFISYGMELGKQPQDKSLDELNQKLQALSSTPGKSKSR